MSPSKGDRCAVSCRGSATQDVRPLAIWNRFPTTQKELLLTPGTVHMLLTERGRRLVVMPTLGGLRGTFPRAIDSFCPGWQCWETRFIFTLGHFPQGIGGASQSFVLISVYLALPFSFLLKGLSPQWPVRYSKPSFHTCFAVL